MPISVVICDDHAVVRSGLRRVLAEQDGIEVVADVGTAYEVKTVAGQLHPDIVILDIGLAEVSGITAIEGVLAASPHTKVLVLTMHDDVAYLREAFAVGASGYVVKAAADVELIQAVHQVANGKRYVHPLLGAALVNNEGATAELPHGKDLGLSERELDILRLLALGHTNAEMAIQMCLSVRTVETYRYRLQQKVGLRSRAELARLARNAGLVD
jgi:two-component system, NarL family, response regulator NreC